MLYITWFLALIGFFALRTVTVDGYSRECGFNQTIFTPEGTTATFLYDFTFTRLFDIHMEKTSESNKKDVVGVRLYYGIIIRTYYYDVSWRSRSNISTIKSDLKIDLNNVSMEDDGTYRIFQDRDYACFILYVMRTRIEPSHSQEENEPIYVFAHPQASLIKRPLTNATMVWLLDGKSDKETASFIEQGDLMWIPSLRKGLNGRDITYRAIQDDGRITEVNTTITVKYGPSHPLSLVPKKTHYYLVSGDIMPDITCTSECYPPCNISWGEHSERETLSLGTVKKEDSGEYACTARRVGGQTIQQTVSIFVADNSYFTIAIICLATVQSLTIIALGFCTFFIYKRKVPFCCKQLSECVSKNKTDNTTVTFSQSNVQGSENRMYEDLKHGTRNNVYGEVNLSIIGDDATVSTYENTNIKS